MRFSARPSPAMVVAVCALVFAMVGSAVAGTDALATRSRRRRSSRSQRSRSRRPNRGSRWRMPRQPPRHCQPTRRHRPTRQRWPTRQRRPTRPPPRPTRRTPSTRERGQRHRRGQRRQRRRARWSCREQLRAAVLREGGLYGRSARRSSRVARESPQRGEGAVGFPRINFPQSMNNCAIIAMTSSAAEPRSFADSSAVSGTQVQLAIQRRANAAVRQNFSIVGIC